MQEEGLGVHPEDFLVILGGEGHGVQARVQQLQHSISYLKYAHK